jgi:regulator of sigma D
MNQFENTTYELISKGQQKYQFTTDMIKYIKNVSKTTLTEKYNKLMSAYLFVNKYIIGEGSNPFIEFVFDEIVENNIYLEGELKHMEEIQKQINHCLEFRNKGHFGIVYDNMATLENNKKELLKKIDIINEIKIMTLKTKEYYIVNYEDFCKDFNIKEINYNVLNKDWNILHHWVKTKQRIFNVLIQNIFDIYNKELDKDNFVKIENVEIGFCSHYKTSPTIHLLDGYKNYVELSTQCNRTSKERGIGIDHADLSTDYTLTYFEPLIDLTKNIIELIDFIQEK